MTQILRILKERRLLLEYKFERLRGQPWEVCQQVREIMNGRGGDAVIITGALNRQTAAMICGYKGPFPTTWAEDRNFGVDRGMVVLQILVATPIRLERPSRHALGSYSAPAGGCGPNAEPASWRDGASGKAGSLWAGRVW